ncbi:protein serine/threonine phosphatase 2C [Durotheca rogersii]|uniref:protein serine/threonine phosphatase 2C n=1 Tax=Durotheca rogersii TaxID=419775 RepID=UPI00221FFE13|nr:protein serine/threonine phosphatase 2C [Durotheca rogersii]KAI5863038.1 protein serine/threonine phosphatase 2C [Durotheca rogersii]
MLSRQLLRRPRLAARVRRVRALSSPHTPRFSSTETQGQASWRAAVKGPLVPYAAGLATASLVAYVVGRAREPQGSAAAAAAVSAPSPAPEVGATPADDGGIPDLNALGMAGEITLSPPASAADVTRVLNARAFSRGGRDGVARYDGAQVASNEPCEDTFLHGSLSTPFGAGDWLTWAVFDGHCGWQMSDLLTRELVPYVRRAFAAAGPTADEGAVERALRDAFTALDDAVVRTAAATVDSDRTYADKARRLEAAYAGACALLALFDPATRTLRVASTGDCRAVLGRRAADGTWAATELTTDQTGANPDEAARLRAQFPNEPEVVRNGRVWGMQPSRTFGDGMWKWPSALKNRLRDDYNGQNLPSAARYGAYRDGPYLTAEPAVTTARIPDAEPSFVILATDGLWDTMESGDAVDLVGRWLDWQARGGAAKPEEEGKGEGEGEGRQDFGPTILGRMQLCKYEPRKAALRDANAAVHLVRNGLGGADDETVRGALTFRYPNSRFIRDDITVQVVFFSPTQVGPPPAPEGASR